jgi:hypothetical protein
MNVRVRTLDQPGTTFLFSARGVVADGGMLYVFATNAFDAPSAHEFVNGEDIVAISMAAGVELDLDEEGACP